MLLYYVQRTMEKEIKKFIPRISEYRMQGEDDKIKRITLSKSIKGCLNAAPWGGICIDRRNKYEIFRLYVFNSIDIKKENLVNSNELWEKKLVPDAYLTEEVWVINQDLIPMDIQYFALNNKLTTKEVSLQAVTLDDKSKLTIDSGIKLDIIEGDMPIYFYLKNDLKFCNKISFSKNLQEFKNVYISKLRDFLPEEFTFSFKSKELKTRISYEFPNKTVLNYKLFQEQLNTELQNIQN